MLLVVFACEFYQRKKIHLEIAVPVSQRLHISLPRKDVRRLDAFFRQLLIRDPLGYTLAGEKPVSFGICETPFSSFSSLLLPNLQLLQGWTTWEKYRVYFADSQFELWKEPSEWGGDLIVLAHKPLCSTVLRENAQDFQAVLAVSSNKVQQILRQRPFFRKGLKGHDALIGIMLGFGRENAWSYYEKKENPCIWNHEIIMEMIVPLAKKSWSFETIEMTDMLLPFFSGAPDSEETNRLKENFISAKDRLQRFYKEKDFLKTTLNLYMNGPEALDSETQIAS